MPNDVPKPRLFYPRNTLAEKTSRLPSTSVEELYASAEAAVAELSDEALDILRREAVELRAACARAPDAAPSLQPDERKRIMAAANTLRELGGSFGYRLVSDIANSLFVLVSTPSGEEPRILTVVDLHADAVEVVLRDDLKDDGGDAGDALLAGLRKAVQRFAAGR